MTLPWFLDKKVTRDDHVMTFLKFIKFFKMEPLVWPSQSKTFPKVSPFLAFAKATQFSGLVQYSAVNSDIKDCGPTAKSFELPRNV